MKLGDTLVYMGSSLPKADISIRPVVGLWNGRIRLSAGFEYVHGLTQINNYAATTRFFTREAYDPETPLRVQACYTAASSPYNNNFCFYETVNVLRLRNLSIGITAPDRLVQLLGARSGTFQILGSNLGVWTNYEGLDPLANTAAASGNRLVGGAVVPRGKTWTMRLRLAY